MIRWLLLTLLVLPFAQVAAGSYQDPLTFSEAVQRLQKTPLLEAERAQLAGAEAKNSATRALALPQLGVISTYGQFSDPVEVDLRPINQVLEALDPAIPEIPNPILQPRDFSFTMATLTWPVFTGGRTRSLQEASAIGIEVASAGKEVTENKLLLDLTARYFGVSVSERALQVQTSVVGSLRTHLRNARILENEGQIAAADRMRAEVALAQAELEEQERQHALENIRAGLSSLLSLGNPDVQTASGPPSQLPAPADLQHLLDDAQQFNPLVRQLNATARQAEKVIGVARSEYWPDVTIVGGFELHSYQLPELIPDWTVTANLTFKIFDGGARKAGVSLAQEEWRTTQALAREAENRVQLDVESRYSSFLDAQRRADVSRRTERLAAESLRMQRAAFAAGEGRSIDVVDAENALAGAKLQRLAADYDCLLAWTSLMLATGRGATVLDVLAKPGVVPNVK
ncbi:TolC family protein [Microbulbifer celer]|uniref:TolC family protein n=1 Tax=Microbulbifer celer TaxID=435905 RepID=A0ABW3U527_9GAMM|nr:TolC family protein [Microbulbifer celer]UFN56634.1 TolC family protein [Microbulbifer celer]